MQQEIYKSNEYLATGGKIKITSRSKPNRTRNDSLDANYDYDLGRNFSKTQVRNKLNYTTFVDESKHSLEQEESWAEI